VAGIGRGRSGMGVGQKKYSSGLWAGMVAWLQAGSVCGKAVCVRPCVCGVCMCAVCMKRCCMCGSVCVCINVGPGKCRSGAYVVVARASRQACSSGAGPAANSSYQPQGWSPVYGPPQFGHGTVVIRPVVGNGPAGNVFAAGQWRPGQSVAGVPPGMVRPLALRRASVIVRV